MPTMENPTAAEALLRSFVEERHPEQNWVRIDNDPMMGGRSAWLLQHQGAFALLRVPAIAQTIISVRAGIAIDIPRDDGLGEHVALANKDVMAGRAFMMRGDAVALVALEEIVWGRALSWDFDPSLADFVTRAEYVLKHSVEMRSHILERFGGRPFAGDDWFALIQ